MIPLRFLFRSRWAALVWATSICLTAVRFAGGDTAAMTVNAANASDTQTAQLSAALAEDD